MKTGSLKGWILFIAVGVLAAACSTDICHKASNASGRFVAKSCNPDGGSAIARVDITKCENNIANCSGVELQKISDYVDCVERIPACVAGQENAFNLAYVGCVTSGVLTVSLTCSQGFN